MGDLPGVAGIVVTAADDVDGVTKAADRYPSEEEGVVHAPDDEDDHDQGDPGTEVGEEQIP